MKNKFKKALAIATLATVTTLGAQTVSADYQVLQGDTAWSIAKNAGIPYNKLVEANPNVDLTNLSIGQTLYFTKQAEEVKVKTKKYMVLQGDGLFRISKKFGMSTAELQAMNPTVNFYELKGGLEILVRAEPENHNKIYLYILNIDKKKGRLTVQPFEGNMFHVYVDSRMMRKIVQTGINRYDGDIITAKMKKNTKNDTFILTDFSVGMN